MEDWIKASGGRRGRIEPLEGGSWEGGSLEGHSREGGIPGGRFLWTFQEGDDQEEYLHWDYAPVVAVREELKKFKIFPWQSLAGIE